MENIIRREELKSFIDASVDESVNKAFKKYGRTSRVPHIRIRTVLLIIILVIGMGGTALWLHNTKEASKQVTPVDNHDLTLDNNGIFGFTVADFKEPILGESTRQKLLIVEEQEVYVNTSITETGLFNWGIFNKEQALTIHGMGQYTIDLSEITSDDIRLDEETYELTIQIPHATLHNVDFDPEKTEIGDTKKGWLAFGKLYPLSRTF